MRPQPEYVHIEADYVAKLAEQTRVGIESDPVVVGMDTADTLGRLDLIIEALGRESADLLFERQRLIAENRDGVPQLCSRRIDCLVKLSRIVVESETKKRESGTMSDETVAKLIKMLVNKVEEVVREIAPAQADAFMSSLNGQVNATSWSTSGARVGERSRDRRGDQYGLTRWLT